MSGGRGDMAVTDDELLEQLMDAGEELLKPLPCVEELLPVLDVRHYLLPWWADIFLCLLRSFARVSGLSLIFVFSS